MNPDVLVLVLSHREAQPVVDRHIKYWQRDGEVRFLVPYDAPLQNVDAIQWCCGKAGHHIEDSVKRVLYGIEAFLHTRFDRLIVHEYDSLCLRPTPWEDLSYLALNCPQFSDTRPERGFIGTVYTHPPLIMTRRIAEKLAEAIRLTGTNVEAHFWDRAVGLACERYRVPINNLLDGMCYARNPIENEHVEAAAQLIRHGGFAVHGVKTEACLRVLEDALR